MRKVLLSLAIAATAVASPAFAAAEPGPYVGVGVTHDSYNGTQDAEGLGFSGVGGTVFAGYNLPIGEKAFAGIEANFDLASADVENAGGSIDARNSFGASARLGYRLSDSTRIFLSYMQLYDAHYSLGASTIPPFFDTGVNLENTFLSSPVYNFNSQFSGPTNKVFGEPSLDNSGIWNAASQMDVKFTQRFQQLQAGLRVPVLQSEYSRVYGTGGFQFSWFFERFFWRTVAQDIDGNARPQDAARYTNTLSQRIRFNNGLGQSYTPAAIGADGTIYSINAGVLFAVGQ